jgi:hypothetical protein
MTFSSRRWAKRGATTGATTTLEQFCTMMVEADLRRNAAGVSF